MRTPTLLFSLPLLVAALAACPSWAKENSTNTSEATTPVSTTLLTGSDFTGLGEKPLSAEEISAPPAVPAGIPARLRIRGATRDMEICSDRIHVRCKDGTEQVIRLDGSRSLEEIDAEAVKYQSETGDRADLVAYDANLPRTELHKLLITRRVTVVLADGVTHSEFWKTTGAIKARRPAFAPEALVLTYNSACEAIAATERLRTVPGVVYTELMVAQRHYGEAVPTNVQYFSGGGPAYDPTPLTDNVDTFILLPIVPTSAYQWWANNRGTPWTGLIPRVPIPALLLGGPVNSVGSRVDLGDLPPVSYVTTVPGVQGEASDIRLPLAWENKVGSDGVSGYNQRILIVDEGIQKDHPDLLNALDPVTTRHRNFTVNPATTTYAPNVAGNNHGTALAGIAAARVKTAPQTTRIGGVAFKSTLQGVVATKTSVDDLEWAESFSLGSTLSDTDRDLDYLDETRIGTVFFDICLNANSASASGDGVGLAAESWLWKRALRFGATKARQTKGVVYVTSAGNGGVGHNNTNYNESKNAIYQIPVASVSELGRRLATPNVGANVVVSAPSPGASFEEELPPVLNWPGRPGGFPSNRPFKKNAPIGPDDVPSTWRRITQGVPTLNTGSGVNFNFGGTSGSAAMVAGVVALMLETNPSLTWRDVKEILLRSGRVVNDVRVTYNGLPAPTLWQMSRLGRPLNHIYGSGLIDADKAVKLAKNWLNLPPDPIPPRQLNVNAANFGDNPSIQATETGGIYVGFTTSRLIPLNGTAVDITLPSPPTNLRIEHVEVRVKFYHQRRGDVEIKLIAPKEINWDTKQPLESDLFVPHLEDSTESKWSTVEAQRNATDWTFTTVRHWGTRPGSTKAWTLRVRDGSSAGKVLTTSAENPIYVPKDNPTDAQSQRVEAVAVTWHGVFSGTPANDPPVVSSSKLRYANGTAIQRAQLTTEPLAKMQNGDIRWPITNWDIYNAVDIVPVQPSNPPRDYFEFYPPCIRDAIDPTILIPLDDPATPEDEWPNHPLPPVWLGFHQTLPEPLVSGASGGLTSQPRWGPGGTPMEMSADNQFMIVRDPKNTNAATNFIHVRLNRKLGELEVVPLNNGRFFVDIIAENLLGMSRPKTHEIQVTNPTPSYADWAALYWVAPDVTDPAIAGFCADPDGDGVYNGLEYAMRLDPTIADPAPIPAYTVEGNEVIFSFQSDTTLGAFVNLHAQVSSDLQTWEDIAVTALTEANGVRNNEARLQVTDPRRFFRLWADPVGPVLGK